MVMATAAPLDQPALQRRGQVCVALAAVAWSTAGLLQRQLTLDVWTQLAGRALFAALALLLYVAIAERGRVVRCLALDRDRRRSASRSASPPRRARSSRR